MGVEEYRTALYIINVKPLLIILALAVAIVAQSPSANLEWKLIKEMSGEIPNHPSLIIELYAARVARGDDKVKLMLKMEFPNGSPREFFRQHVPHGTDPTSIAKIEGAVEFNCRTLVVKPIKSTANVYQFNGKKFKSKEPPFGLDSGHIFAQYFCEQGEAPTKAPTLKP